MFYNGSTFHMRYGFNYLDNWCFNLSHKFNFLLLFFVLFVCVLCVDMCCNYFVVLFVIGLCHLMLALQYTRIELNGI